MVSHDSIGDKGRPVRCAKCGHSWFQKSEKDALDDLIARIQSEEMDDIAFTDGKSGQKQSVSPKKTKEKTESLLFRWQKMVVGNGILKLCQQKFREFLQKHPIFYFLTSKTVEGIVLAIAVFLVLVNIAIQARVTVCSFIPALEKVYEAAGYDVLLYSKLTAKHSLAVERLAVNLPDNKQDKSVILTGTLVNLTDENVYIPAFALSFIKQDGSIAGERLIAAMAQTVLNKEATVPLSLRLEDGFPEGAARVSLQFLSEAEAAAHIRSYPTPEQVHVVGEDEDEKH